MVMSRPDYLIYPSLLDKYQMMVDAEQEAEALWNRNPDGSTRLSPEEIYLRAEAELLAMINREPRKSSPAAARGTALNDVVDLMVTAGAAPVKTNVTRVYDGKRVAAAHTVTEEGFTFNFDIALCRLLADEMAGSVCQYKFEQDIETSDGLVRLYGYSDYWRGGQIIDLKTTSAYDARQYDRKWQRRVYPWCATEGGSPVDEFIYLAVVLPPRAADGLLPVKLRSLPESERQEQWRERIYPEVYTYDHKVADSDLRDILTRFIAWLKWHKDLITHGRIFGKD